MKSFYTSCIWLLPFCFFIAGYMGARLYMTPAPIRMPSLVGMNSTQALTLLSDYHLIPHIVAHKEENNVPHGTVLQQTPAPGHSIKQRQTIFLVLSTACQPTRMPDYIHHTLTDIQQQSAQKNITLQIYHVPHTWPQNTCFAQWPSAGELLAEETPIVYIACASPQPVIWPDFIGHDAADIINFLREHHITPDIICNYKDADIDSYAGYRITDQRPLAGSCIYIDKPEHIMAQLRVE